MSQAGALLLALAGLWIAYLVPHRLRFRQQLLESRTDDRFSEALRVVRVIRAEGTNPERQVAVRSGLVLLHPPARRGGGSVDRPHALTDRVIADAVRRSAAEQAHRAAYLSRRAAGARRRAVLAVALTLGTLTGWVAALAGALVVVGALVPTVLLGSVLVLGRRAVVQGHRADAAWAAAAPERAARRALVTPAAVGRAVRPSNDSTQIMARVPAERSTERLAEPTPVVAEALGGPAWEPVPVPRPSYSLKPAVRRPEPAPLPAEDLETVAAAAAPEVVEDDLPEVETTGTIDLDAILARRRAAGE